MMRQYHILDNNVTS